jgi:hypothetical protein
MSIDYSYVSNKILHLEQGVSLYNAKPSLHFWQQEAFIPAYYISYETLKRRTYKNSSTTPATGLIKLLVMDLRSSSLRIGWSEPAATNAPIEDEAIQAVLG